MNLFGNRTPIKTKNQKVAHQEEERLSDEMEDTKKKTQEAQKMMASREIRAQELERLIKERESEIEELDAAIASRREAADQMIIGVTVQVQEMIDALDKQMEQLDTKTQRQLETIGKANEAQTQELQTSLSEFCETSKLQTEDIQTDIKALQGSLDDLKTQMDQKLEQVQLADTSIEKIKSSFSVWKFFSFFAVIDFVMMILLLLCGMGVFR
jgi:chromosome segregation ATPase